MTTEPRRFHLQRRHDPTGVSGTGRVADGIAWPDGTVTLRWRGERPSTVNWSSLADAVHVHGHGGTTEVVWDDPAPTDQPEGRPMTDTPATRMRAAAERLARPHRLVADPLRPALAAWLEAAATDAEMVGASPQAGAVADAILTKRSQDSVTLTLPPGSLSLAAEPPPRIIPVPVDRYGHPLR
ncbi:hypothetical protein GCM10027160_23890 [Streptomyces calidiresistens]|uniref:hypothetical protein n=1 Tax=Streptomyces calidiresistens TaxID=1485586 RepID=UPI001E5E4DCD|nr:hypothetical protein [Streptomyces calidiresistens]